MTETSLAKSGCESLGYPRTVHPFPARMASEVALDALVGLPPKSTVLDPMCGSGVVVRRALDSGHNGIGFDIDPLAVLMTRVWTSEISRSIQPDLGWELAERARTLIGTEIELPWIDQDQPTADYINFWFLPAQREQIRALIAASRQLRGQRKNLVSLALSRIIVTKSNGASIAADTSHSRPHRVRTENDFDVFMGFARSFKRLLKILKDSPVKSSGRVRRGDARTLRGIRTSSVDAVVTSPPYLNAIDYLRGHKLALVWLGYSMSQISSVKSLGVGARSQRKRQDTDRLDEIVKLATIGELTIDTRRVVASYTSDMMSCLRQAYRVLHRGGYAVYVLSNSVLRGTEFDTARIVIEAASDAGFHFEGRYARDIPREHRYLPPPQTTANVQLAARMRTESVLRFCKSE